MLQKTEMRNIFDQCSPTVLKGLFEKKVMYPLAKRGPNRELIIGSHAVNWDPSEYDFVQGFAGVVMLFNFCTASSLLTQEEGIIFVMDFGGWSFKMVRAVKIGLVKMFARYFNSCTPAKIKAFHIINYPPVIKMIHALMKPIVRSKMLDRFHFHDDGGTTSLREELEFLPESLGGTAKADCVDREMLELLYEQDKYYQDLVKFFYPPY